MKTHFSRNMLRNVRFWVLGFILLPLMASAFSGCGSSPPPVEITQDVAQEIQRADSAVADEESGL